MGYRTFMERTDALLMGRKTYEKVLSFGIPWPYEKPVFVWSSKLKTVPQELEGKVGLVAGPVAKILSEIHSQGYSQLYVDGGSTIQVFLKKDLIDEMIITRIPVLLGGGIPLFGELSNRMRFSLVKSEVFLGEMVQDTYLRKR
ncbi:dihydrofolate reductase family protein [Maribellus sediminis]|uniref:dihydrofolate reductase family protein n=1 Tax=Maribellus sediminis TaxID=2696285 RepID=UPI00197CCB82|nr:dihydrofolate reductase family protein [Maribellus sediminis]